MSSLPNWRDQWKPGVTSWVKYNENQRTTHWQNTVHRGHRWAQWTVQTFLKCGFFWDDATMRSWELLVPKGSKRSHQPRQKITNAPHKSGHFISPVGFVHLLIYSCLSGYPFISNSHDHTHFALLLHLRQEVAKTSEKERQHCRSTENETFDPSSLESLHKKDGVSWIRSSFYLTASVAGCITPVLRCKSCLVEAFHFFLAELEIKNVHIGLHSLYVQTLYHDSWWFQRHLNCTNGLTSMSRIICPVGTSLQMLCICGFRCHGDVVRHDPFQSHLPWIQTWKAAKATSSKSWIILLHA